MKNEIAILVAAGNGSRMLPLTETIPKPLIKVHGKPMIETNIEALNKRGVDTIYIVVGYKKEQFYYLKEKYDNVVLIENTEYQIKNNISSFFAVKEKLIAKNAFICDADLVINNQNIFHDTLPSSCFFAKVPKGKSKDWVFKVKDGRVLQLCLGGTDDYRLVGISYWKKEDLLLLKNAVENAYRQEGHESLFWEEVANRCFEKLVVTVHTVIDEDIMEIDTYAELKAIDKSYIEIE